MMYRITLTSVLLLVATSALPAAAQQPLPFADLYYFTGTPPMTRLNHAKVGVVLDMTPQGLHFDIEKKGSELTAQEAEEALGVPELLDTAQYCSKEKLSALGLCDSAKDVVLTHRFNFFTRDKHHYSLLFLGNGDNFKYWRLLPGEGLQTSDVNQTDWTPMAGSATFITVIRTKVTPWQSGKLNRLIRITPLKSNYGSLDKFLRGEVNHFGGYDARNESR